MTKSTEPCHWKNAGCVRNFLLESNAASLPRLRRQDSWPHLGGAHGSKYQFLTLKSTASKWNRRRLDLRTTDCSEDLKNSCSFGPTWFLNKPASGWRRRFLHGVGNAGNLRQQRSDKLRRWQSESLVLLFLFVLKLFHWLFEVLKKFVNSAGCPRRRTGTRSQAASRTLFTHSLNHRKWKKKHKHSQAASRTLLTHSLNHRK